MALAPVAGQVVTSEVGTVERVDPANGSLTVLLDEGRRTVLAGPFTSSQRLAHDCAVTVHRSQGATVVTAHYLEEGGRRELSYVGLSPTRTRPTVYAVADELDQAVEDFSEAWSIERCQEWVIDQGLSLGRIDTGGHPGFGLSAVALTPETFLESLGAVVDGAGQARSVQLPADDMALLLDALDSHEYWQIGDVLPRNDGMVWIPGDSVGVVDRYWEDGDPTDEQADAIEQVRRCRALAERIRLVLVEA